MPNSIVVEQGFQCPNCPPSEEDTSKDLLIEARFAIHKPIFNEVVVPGENGKRFPNVPFINICAVGCNRCIQDVLIREIEGTLGNYRHGVYTDSIESPPEGVKFIYTRFVNTICRQTDAQEYHGDKVGETGIIINGIIELFPMKMTRFDKMPSRVSMAVFEACEHCYSTVITSSEHSSVNNFIKSVITSLDGTDFSDPLVSATGDMIQRGIQGPR